MARILVLGAGMVGTCTALHLARRGHDVVLVDRREPGRETSFGNAGIIQREAVEPHPFPRDWRELLTAALKRDTDVNYHFAALPGLLPLLWRYRAASAPHRYAAIAAAYARLIAHSRDEHAALIAACGAAELVREDGYLQVYRGAAALAAAGARAQRLAQQHGLRVELLEAAELARIEPALHGGLAGAVHWRDPWCVRDPGELVARYARHFLSLGGRLCRGDAASLRRSDGAWQVQGAEGPLVGAHAVIALGPWSAALTRRLGFRLPLFIKRGYHAHFTGGPPLQRPVLDVERGFVLAPMVQGIRLTTGAEFARLDSAATPVQLAKVTRAARELVDLPRPVEPVPWLGNRPCTVDMKPVIGPAPGATGLWFNFGHAHQGFTMGPASGRLLAQLIDGETPLVDPAPYLPERFR